MKYLLDTDACIYALKQREPMLANLLAHRREDVALSVISVAELRVGAAKSNAPAKTTRLIENFLRPIQVLEFSEQDALTYGQVRAKLERSGTPIGSLDTLIAAQAVSRKLVLVTNNQREFRRINGLHLENWTAE